MSIHEQEDLKKQFGDDRLIGILRNTHFNNARQVIDTLASEVEKQRNGADPNDDLTMLCLKIIWFRDVRYQSIDSLSLPTFCLILIKKVGELHNNSENNLYRTDRLYSQSVR